MSFRNPYSLGCKLLFVSYWALMCVGKQSPLVLVTVLIFLVPHYSSMFTAALMLLGEKRWEAMNYSHTEMNKLGFSLSFLFLNKQLKINIP